MRCRRLDYGSKISCYLVSSIVVALMSLSRSIPFSTFNRLTILDAIYVAGSMETEIDSYHLLTNGSHFNQKGHPDLGQQYGHKGKDLQHN